MRLPRRLLIPALLFLLAGLLVNMSIAAALSIWGKAPVTERLEPSSTDAWPEWAPPAWLPWNGPATPGRRGIEYSIERWAGFGLRARLMIASNMAEVVTWRPSLNSSVGPPQYWHAHALRIESGIPFRSFALEYGAHETARGVPTRTRAPGLLGGLTPPWSPNSDRLYPVAPLWPGFAINTVFYALVLWLPFLLFRILRRRSRLRRGLCARCAYDLRGHPSAPCPECGPPHRSG